MDSPLKGITMKLSLNFLISLLILIPALLWGYGFKLASDDLNEGLSLLEAGFTHKTLNPVSAMGYKYKLNNSRAWQGHINGIQCERNQRKLINSIYTFESFGSDVYKYRKEALKEAIDNNCN